jgi:hypothetical protein
VLMNCYESWEGELERHAERKDARANWFLSDLRAWVPLNATSVTPA